MNDSTDQLLQQLGDIGSPKDGPESARPASEQADAAHLPSDDQDHWRILLVDLVYLLNASFRDVRYWAGVRKEQDTFRQFVKVLHELSLMSKTGETVHILFRGSAGGKVPEKADYIILFGDLAVDGKAVDAVIKRIGIRVKHLEGRLIKAFKELSDQEIYTVSLRIPDSSAESREKLRVSLRIISCFKKAVEEGTPIEYFKDDRQYLLNPIPDESDQPDPNLTLLAALNDLSPEKMQAMVQKVNALTKRPDFAQAGIRFSSVYQVIFKIESLRKRLTRPPIELNNEVAPGAEKFPKGVSGATGIRGSAAFSVQGTDAGLGGGLPAIDSAGLKKNLFQLVKETYGNSPETVKQAMNTVYGGDYRQLDLSGLEKRIQQLTDLLTSMENSDKGRLIMEDVLRQIQEGVDQVPKDLLDDIVVKDGVLKIWDEDEEKIIGSINNDLLTVIDTSKDRSAIRRKMRTAIQPDMQFSDQDLEQLAEAFDIPIHDAQEIVGLFKSCFDQQSNFQRALFEKNLPGFAAHKKRIFEILWEFLIETPDRSDRLPFLNSLQLLVKEISQPKQAIKTLISHFILDPEEIRLYDRNALMLAIQFLRKYNKEINMDIEITLEEVLFVKQGLDHSVVRYAAWKIEGEQKRFVKKILTIRRKLLYSFEPEGSDPDVLPTRFMLALEREAHIFLALVGGNTAAAVIRGALNVYGNPGSQIYQFKKSRQYAASLLQHLAILIRGLGRVGGQTDLVMLDEIKKREPGFISLAPDPRHSVLVQRTLGWIDAAKNEINAKKIDKIH